MVLHGPSLSLQLRSRTAHLMPSRKVGSVHMPTLTSVIENQNCWWRNIYLLSRILDPKRLHCFWLSYVFVMSLKGEWPSNVRDTKMHLNHIRIVWVIISLSSKINPFELLKEYESDKFARLQCTRPKLVVHYTWITNQQVHLVL